MQAIVDGTGHGHYHISSGSDFAIKELFDATIAALPEVELDEDVEVRPKGEDDAYTILLDPSRIQQDFGWEPKVPLEEGVRRAIEYYREYGISQTFTHLKVARVELRRHAASSSSAGPASSAPTSCARCSRASRARSSSSTTCSRPSARTCRTTTGVRLIEASINDDDVLAGLPRDLDYVFHLSTYHGNQSSMADPLADHEHNTLTTLKLYEALKDHDRLQARRLRVGGLHGGREDVRGRRGRRRRTRRSRCELDSPYQISKIIGEYYSQLLLPRGTGCRP